jgi:putative spermidine/putrescine transport system substrate-binding protein
MSRLWRFVPVVALLAVIVCTVTLGDRAGVAQQKQLVIASWGGSYSESQRKAFFEPFAKATGIRVVEAPAPKSAVIKAMVESGNVEWDVMDLTAFQLFSLAQQGLLEKLDYSRLDQRNLSNIDAQVRREHGVGAIYYSNVIAYNTDTYSKENHPRTWAEFWDVKRFPGPRALRSARVEGQPDLEAALMADGVPMDKLYPLDLDRAFRSLTRIKPHVVKWFETPGQAGEMLARGDVVLAEAPAARIYALKKQGAKVDYEWNQGKLRLDFWAIPKGAKNVGDAMRFIDFALAPERQAEQVKIYPGGPTNAKAYDFIAKELLAELPSSPENLKKQYRFNDEYWLAPFGNAGKSNQDVINERWNAWVLE